MLGWFRCCFCCWGTHGLLLASTTIFWCGCAAAFLKFNKVFGRYSGDLQSLARRGVLSLFFPFTRKALRSPAWSRGGGYDDCRWNSFFILFGVGAAGGMVSLLLIESRTSRVAAVPSASRPPLTAHPPFRNTGRRSPPPPQ
jgi:hypothetical protein